MSGPHDDEADQRLGRHPDEPASEPGGGVGILARAGISFALLLGVTACGGERRTEVGDTRRSPQQRMLDRDRDGYIDGTSTLIGIPQSIAEPRRLPDTTFDERVVWEGDARHRFPTDANHAGEAWIHLESTLAGAHVIITTTEGEIVCQGVFTEDMVGFAQLEGPVLLTGLTDGARYLITIGELEARPFEARAPNTIITAWDLERPIEVNHAEHMVYE